MDTLLEDGAHVRVGRINGKGDWSLEFRVSEHRDGGKEELGAVEGVVKHWGPRKRLALTLEGLGQRS